MTNQKKYLLYGIVVYHILCLFWHCLQQDCVFIENFQININECSFEELYSIPGIGKKNAWKIYSYRTQNGSFQSLDDLKFIKGIGNKFIEKIRAYVVVHDSTNKIP